MRRHEVFWGTLLVVLGVLFFLKTAGYLSGDVFGWFWPFCIVAAGVWVLLGGGFRQDAEIRRSSSFSVPLQGAREATLTINHGVGRMELTAGAEGNDFVTGLAAASMNRSARRVGDRLEVRLETGPSFLPFLGPPGGVWSYRLHPGVPTALVVHAGASQLKLELRSLRVTRLDYDGGVGSLEVSLPAEVAMFVSQIRAGASSLRLRVPYGVAARLSIQNVGSLSIDTSQFVPRESGVYQSADYQTASKRADITIEGGATSIRVDQEAS